MITQFQLRLETGGRPLACDDAYHLYAALLESAPASFGELVHEQAVSPVSQYLRREKDRAFWTVTLLGEEAERQLSDLLREKEQFFLRSGGRTAAVAARTERRIDSVDGLFLLSAAENRLHRLTFVSPAVFKSRGEYSILPSSRLIVQSLIKKWNGCFPDCPIEDEDGEGMDAIAAGLHVRSYQLRDREYHMKNQTIPGFIGSLTLENRLQGFHRELADALLAFSCFSGIGAKTTLGMGGVLLG